MRNEKEIYDLILNTAKNDERIKAVYMNGSRTNKNAVKDIFQDYDVVYVVSETKPFIEDKSFINTFGDILYMQCPAENDMAVGCEVDIKNCYGWLMQFKDGNRIDLHVQSVEFSRKNILEDKLCEILLDKDNVLPEIPESTDEDHFVKRPSEAEFKNTCNEFWWCLNNVAKGLWREEITYTQDMINYHVRPQLVKVLSWKIGLENNFSCSIGKSGKYMYRYLTKDMWDRFLKTYSGYKVSDIYEAVDIMCRMLDEAAHDVSEGVGFMYNEEEGKASFEFFNHVKELPKDAKEIY